VAGYDSGALIERALTASREISDVDDAQAIAACAIAAAIAELSAAVTALGVMVGDVAEAITVQDEGQDHPG